MADVVMPQLGETVTEGTITKWFKQIGDPIAVDEVLFEVSTDKVDSEVPSPVAGFLAEIRVPEGDTVDVGGVIAVVSDAPPVGGGAPVEATSAADAAPAGADDAGAPPAPELANAVPVPDPDAPRNRIILPGDVPSPIDPPEGCAFAWRCGTPKAMQYAHRRPTLTEVEPGHWVDDCPFCLGEME